MEAYRVRDDAAAEPRLELGVWRDPTEPYLHGREREVNHTGLRGSGRGFASVDEKRDDDDAAGQRLTHHYLLRHDVQDLPRHVDHLLDVLALRELLHAVLGEGQLLRGVLGRVRS